MQESSGHDDNQQATLFDRGFLSGMFLGEGTVGFANTYFSRVVPRIRISNTDKALIDEITRIYKLMEIPFHVENYARGNGYQDSWTVSIVGWKRTNRFVKEFLPITVGNKHFQLVYLQELYVLRESKKAKDPYTEKEATLISKIKALNKKNRESSETNEHRAANNAAMI